MSTDTNDVRISKVYYGVDTLPYWQALFDVNCFYISKLYCLPGVGRKTVAKMTEQGMVDLSDPEVTSFTRKGMEYVSSKFGGALRVPSEEELAAARVKYFEEKDALRIANEAWRSNRDAVLHMEQKHHCFVRLEGRKVWFVKTGTVGEQHGGKYACFLPSAFQGFVYTDSTMRESLDSVLIPARELKWEDGMPCAD